MLYFFVRFVEIMLYTTTKYCIELHKTHPINSALLALIPLIPMIPLIPLIPWIPLIQLILLIPLICRSYIVLEVGMGGWVRGYFWNAYAVNLLGREFFQQTKNVKLRFYLTFDSAKMINSLFFLI